MKYQKTAVVTGSSQGIGFQISKKLLSNGYVVYGISRSGTGPKSENFHPLKFDLTHFDKYSGFIKKLPQKIDILVNNAGLGFEKFTHKIKAGDIDKTFHLNFYAPVLLTSALLTNLKDSASVFYISSVMSMVSDPGYSLYCASKSALDRYSSTLAKEHPRLQVITIMPAGTKTPMYPSGTILPEQIAEVLYTAIQEKFASGSRLAVVNYSSRDWWAERDTYDLTIDLG